MSQMEYPGNKIIHLDEKGTSGGLTQSRMKNPLRWQLGQNFVKPKIALSQANSKTGNGYADSFTICHLRSSTESQDED
jgi:hypothetical protein